MSEDYLRLIAGQLHSQLFLLVSHDLFGKSWYTLDGDQQLAVRGAVGRLLIEHFDWLTPEYLADLAKKHQQQGPLGEKKPPIRVKGFEVPDKKD